MSNFNVGSAAKINLALAFAGMLVWIIISQMTDRKEAWDSDLFWSIGVPLMFVINGIGAFLDPRRIAVKGIVSVALQPIAMIIMAGEIGSLFPLGLILFGFMGFFYSIGGVIGAFLKKQFFSSRETRK